MYVFDERNNTHCFSIKYIVYVLEKQAFSQQPISLAYLSLLGLEETDFHTLQF